MVTDGDPGPRHLPDLIPVHVAGLFAADGAGGDEKGKRKTSFLQPRPGFRVDGKKGVVDAQAELDKLGSSENA